MTAPAKGAAWYTYQKALDEEVEAARDGEASLLDKQNAQDVLIDGKSPVGHSHGAGGEVISLVANTAALGTGATNGELKITVDNGNRYIWDAGNSKWQIMDGNQYTTANLPNTVTYTILTGTQCYDTTTNLWQKYNGSSWVVLISAHALIAKTANHNITATELLAHTVFTNKNAAGGIEFTLPAGIAGSGAEFIVAENQYLKVTANGTEKFRYGSGLGAAGGYIRANAVGTVWHIEFDGTDWIIKNIAGGPLAYDATGFWAGYKYYDTILIPASFMTPNATNGPATGSKEYATNDVNRDYFAFDATTMEHVSFSVVFPEDWDRGTIRIKYHWSSATGSTAGDIVAWAVRGKFCRNDDAIDAAYGTVQVVSDTLLANNGDDHQISGRTPQITLGGTAALGAIVDLDVYRNIGGADNMTEDAWLFYAVIQFARFGALEEWS